MYRNFEQLCALCAAEKKPLWRLILDNECALQNTSKEAVFAELDKRFRVMEESAFKALNTPLSAERSLISGYASRHHAYTQKGSFLCGSFINRVMSLALSVSEVNASMGRICAAPTAGSSGIIPAVLIALYEREFPVDTGHTADSTDKAEAAAGSVDKAGAADGQTLSASRKKILCALLTASGLGAVIVKNATVSGAEGGCQAECASAAAMASAAAVEFAGGTIEQSMNAFSFSLMNAMGLVCDPIAGLVQIPCAQRNASQAVNALISADMALAGMSSPVPPDEVLEAMFRTGKMLPAALKETAKGGLAATKTAKSLAKELLG
ncbi:L-serine ammonia-lyase, iron-sulfur-dependent, subunit alpha [Treponema sp. OMZ 840]|uniref:L-serine ammonia-lyase, iron-sulfur-dependent, subunit alpha n=1 Tax=Treponema sp. OMZ 840 TaxID=244313 RepID=UPI003D945D45